MSSSLGKYQLIVELARGGMGIVYLARVPGPGGFRKMLIVKELKPEFVEDESFLAMFLEEARLAARLEHPNIVQTIEVGHEGSRHYLAMEYLQGHTLERVRRRLRDVDPLLKVTADALRGLHHAHTLKDYDGSNLGLVHRDVSATNIFVTFGGHTKLVDFGVAKAADSNVKTQVGTFKGKSGYMAPEQFLGHPIDARVDIYATGIMLCELITGKRFWDGVTEPEVMKKLLDKDVPTLRQLMPDADPELARICDRARDPNPDGRYATAEELRLDLEAYLATRPPFAQGEVFGAQIAKAFERETEALRVIVEKSLTREKLDSSDSFGNTVPYAGMEFTSSSVERRPSEMTPAPTASVTQAASAPRRGVMIGAGLGALAIAGLTGAFFFGQRPATPSGTATSTLAPNDANRPASSASDGPKTLPVRRSYALALTVSPPTATVTANGDVVDASAPLRCGSGDTIHLSVGAPGYVAKDRDLACDGDRTVDLSLERRPDAPAVAAIPARPSFAGRSAASSPRGVLTVASPPPVVAPPPPAPPPTPDKVPTGKRPQRQIDPTDPYK